MTREVALNDSLPHFEYFDFSHHHQAEFIVLLPPRKIKVGYLDGMIVYMLFIDVDLSLTIIFFTLLKRNLKDLYVGNRMINDILITLGISALA